MSITRTWSGEIRIRATDSPLPLAQQAGNQQTGRRRASVQMALHLCPVRAFITIAVLICAAASSAVAQDAEIVAATSPEEARARDLDVSLIGGIGGFTGTLSGVTDPGPSWGLQLNAHATGYLHLEVAYTGFHLPFSDTRVQYEHMFIHGLSGVAKLVVPYTRTVSPFIGAGAGVYLFLPTQNAQAYYRVDRAIGVPAIIGIQWETDFFEAGVRGTWRGMFGKNQVTTEKGGGILSGELTLGIRF